MLVWTLPSPACMCSATNTRPRSTCLWIFCASSRIGLNSPPLKILRSSARTSLFQLTRMVRSCSRWNTFASGCWCRRSSSAGPSRPRPWPISAARAVASGTSRWSCR
ncbi:hypothetical protein D3C72_997050 [compost metagenome]